MYENSQQKRILHIVGGMNRRGTEIMIMNLYRVIDRDKIQFDFVYFNNRENDFDVEIRRMGGRIFRVPSPREVGVIRFIHNLVKVIRENGPFSAVHAHTLHNIGLALLAARIAGVTCRIAHSHSTKATEDTLIHKVYQIVMKLLIRFNATHLLACGKDAGHFLFGKTFDKKGIVFPNAIDLSEYYCLNKEDAKFIRKMFGISEETLIIGQVGALKKVKNHKFSIAIARKLKDNGIDFKMMFVGDGEMRQELEQQAVLEGVSDKILFLGVRSDIPNLLNMFDVLIMPSIYEGLPVSLVEAQAAGTPCVVSDVITPEVDLGLNLISFVNLGDELDRWEYEILKQSQIQRPSKDIILRAFRKKGYDVVESVKSLRKIYSI
ncbi:glycosyltransferase family 1 protein [Parageobacillus thermoglucosidasius]|uniref:glycosyltransferase family 1 protein n=1 Tax=Parageobacillus thermoglucosidasius TaxID=1426 RepID=UPI00025B4899|nr:glycosyltransferase family 1 protein [Parageobacillus thermoglucosidasius]KYD12586.1 hypothetical protein B4168_3489 [Anoxybacillus flavithermus]ALF08808.1 hypothetical protein AOT13_01420 [Parageobacillus thermoglucosidasius]EID42384.1 glycosyl transferase, family 1 [Parageobacillus thermoglucosidasius TNO-09.020]OAO84617.1 putative capsular polysaccharide biosynthesis proteinGlycosyl Transferase Family 4 YveP [Parageobacillus thermoglucosidasius]BDG30603.1 putative glycosyltransferase Eps